MHEIERIKCGQMQTMIVHVLIFYLHILSGNVIHGYLFRSSHTSSFVGDKQDYPELKYSGYVPDSYYNSSDYG